MENVYVILTHKDGQFHTELCDGLIPVAQYDYLYCGRRRARFVIAQLVHPVRVALVEDTAPHVRNLIPSKFLPRFDSVDAARAELEQLVAFNREDAGLLPVTLT